MHAPLKGSPPSDSDVPIFRVKASRFGQPLSVREIFAYRYLFWMMALRDVQVKYKQAWLGFIWLMLNPVAMMLVFTYMFQGITKVDTQEIPYPVFVMPGLIIWFLISRSLGEASCSLAGNLGLMTKVYFPRIMLPAGAMVGHLVDFFVSLILVVLLLAYYGIMPSPTVFLAPIFVLVGLLLVLGLALWLSALDALARDVRHILTPVIMAWMFATPVVYPSNAAPGALQYVVLLNPLTPVVEGFRWSILGMGVRPSFTALAVCAGVAVLLIVTGGAYFRAVERTIIDTM